jgi:hypothetical protein
VDLQGGLSRPTTFAVGYLVLRAVHVALFTVASQGDPGLRRQVALFSAPMAGATCVLLVAAQTSGVTTTVLWACALLVWRRSSGSACPPACGGRTSTPLRSGRSTISGWSRVVAASLWRRSPTPTST